jgi:hypothetical protein
MRFLFKLLLIITPILCFGEDNELVIHWKKSKSLTELYKKIRTICDVPEKIEHPNTECRQEHLSEINKLLIEEGKSAEWKVKRFWKTVPPELRGPLFNEIHFTAEDDVPQLRINRFLTPGTPEHKELLSHIEENNIKKKYPHFKVEHIIADYNQYYSSYARYSILQLACNTAKGEPTCPNHPGPEDITKLPYLPYGAKSPGQKEGEVSEVDIGSDEQGITALECKNIRSPDLKTMTVPEYTEMKKLIGRCMNWCAAIKDSHPELCDNVQDKNFNLETSGTLSDSDSRDVIRHCEWEWYSQNFEKRNLKTQQICQRIENTPLSAFNEELITVLGGHARTIYEQTVRHDPRAAKHKQFTPQQATYHSYPDLIRLEGISKFLDAHCQFTGQSLSSIPHSCQRFSKGIQKFKCQENSSTPLTKPQKKNLITISKKITALATKKTELIKERYLIRQAMNTPVYGGCGTQESCRAYYSTRFQRLQILNEKIPQIESVLFKLSSSNPLIFSSLSGDSPFNKQQIEKLDSLKRFSKLDPENINSNKFDQAMTRSKSEASRKIKSSLSKMCDSGSDGFSMKELMSMRNLTQEVSSKWPQFKIVEGCFQERLDTIDNLLFVGGAGLALSCIVGSMGPQGLLIGSLCGGIFTGISTIEYQNSSIRLGEVTDCRSAGDNVCTDEYYQQTVEEYNSSLTNLQLTLLLLPLEVIGVSKALKQLTQSMSKIKTGANEAKLITRFIDDEVKAISRLSDDALKEQRLKELAKEIDQDPSGFLRRKLSSSIDDLNVSGIDGLSLSKIPAGKRDSFAKELKNFLKGCQ